jgi:hypothetical protein
MGIVDKSIAEARSRAVYPIDDEDGEQGCYRPNFRFPRSRFEKGGPGSHQAIEGRDMPAQSYFSNIPCGGGVLTKGDYLSNCPRFLQFLIYRASGKPKVFSRSRTLTISEELS